MIITLSADGSLFTTVPENINQGSNNANTIAVVSTTARTNNLMIAFKLPQTNVYTKPVLMTLAENIDEQTGFNVWTYTLDAVITQNYGECGFQIQVVTPTETLASNYGSFLIQKGIPAELPAEPTQTIYEQILSNISAINADLYNLKKQVADISAGNKDLLPYDQNYSYPALGAIFDYQTNAIYVSLGDGNKGNALTNTTWWRKYELGTVTNPMALEQYDWQQNVKYKQYDLVSLAYSNEITFYISLINDNNKMLSDTTAWAGFKLSTDADTFVDDNSIYKIYATDSDYSSGELQCETLDTDTNNVEGSPYSDGNPTLATKEIGKELSIEGNLANGGKFKGKQSSYSQITNEGLNVVAEASITKIPSGGTETRVDTGVNIFARGNFDPEAEEGYPNPNRNAFAMSVSRQTEQGATSNSNVFDFTVDKTMEASFNWRTYVAGTLTTTETLKLRDLLSIKPAVDITIEAPAGATNGTLTEEQFTLLTANTRNRIILDNEIYNLSDPQVDAGYYVYSHLGEDSTHNFFAKCITVTISTRGWVLTSADLRLRSTTCKFSELYAKLNELHTAGHEILSFYGKGFTVEQVADIAGSVTFNTEAKTTDYSNPTQMQLFTESTMVFRLQSIFIQGSLKVFNFRCSAYAGGKDHKLYVTENQTSVETTALNMNRKTTAYFIWSTDYVPTNQDNVDCEIFYYN